MTINDVAERLKSADNILILTHKNPDGDTTGCAAALCLALRKLGKTSYIFENPDITPRYAKIVEDKFQPVGFNPEFIVSVDIASTRLLTSNANKYSDKIDLAIDHHGTNELFAHDSCVDADAAACGEIIYEIICKLNAQMSKDIADMLYIAIATDTGCFLHANTTSKTHRIVSELFKYNIDFYQINREFFVVKSKKRIKVEGLLSSGMCLFADGKIAVIAITQELLRATGATEDDLDDISAMTRSIDGVEVGITIRENLDGTSKISMRTSKNINASEVCAAFGGGGHLQAAGCTISAGPKQAMKMIVDKILEISKISQG